MTDRMISVDTPEVNLPELLELLADGDDLVLVYRGTPVARVSPVANKHPAGERVFGLHTGSTWVSDDFDDPLPDEFWLGEV